MRSLLSRSALALSIALAAGCGSSQPAGPAAPPGPAVAPPAEAKADAPKPATARVFNQLDRATFNKLAVRQNQGAYWSSDEDKDGALDPDELSTLLFYPTTAKWTDGGAFTPAFEKLYDGMVEASNAPPSKDARRALVEKELDDAASVLVRTDLRKETAETNGNGKE